MLSYLSVRGFKGDQIQHGQHARNQNDTEKENVQQQTTTFQKDFSAVPSSGLATSCFFRNVPENGYSLELFDMFTIIEWKIHQLMTDPSHFGANQGVILQTLNTLSFSSQYYHFYSLKIIK